MTQGSIIMVLLETKVLQNGTGGKMSWGVNDAQWMDGMGRITMERHKSYQCNSSTSFRLNFFCLKNFAKSEVALNHSFMLLWVMILSFETYFASFLNMLHGILLLYALEFLERQDNLRIWQDILPLPWEMKYSLQKWEVPRFTSVRKSPKAVLDNFQDKNDIIKIQSYYSCYEHLFSSSGSIWCNITNFIRGY